jgi:pantoate--beta-alanine ligase
MNICTQLKEWRALRGSAEWAGQTVGFVPTMGALHAGHAALLERACKENDRVVLSIFVNPTQFNDANDLTRYPRTFEADVQLARPFADAVVAPTAEEFYPDGYRYRVTKPR